MTREQARNKAMSKAFAEMVLAGRNELDYDYAIEEFEKLWPIEKEAKKK